MRSSKCVFDVQGNVSLPSNYMSVTKTGNMLVVQLLTNLIIPFRIKSIGLGFYELYIVDRKIVSFHGKNTALTLTIDGVDSAGVFVDFAVGGDIVIGQLSAGGDFVLGEAVFPEAKVYAWAKENGACMPIGCAITTEGVIIEHECRLERTKTAYVVKFPNGFAFPMRFDSEKICVFGTDVPCKFVKYAMLSVNVDSIAEDCVKFSVAVYCSGELLFFDWFTYNKSGVRCGESFISTANITKQFVLGGIYA